MIINHPILLNEKKSSSLLFSLFIRLNGSCHYLNRWVKMKQTPPLSQICIEALACEHSSITTVVGCKYRPSPRGRPRYLTPMVHRSIHPLITTYCNDFARTGVPGTSVKFSRTDWKLETVYKQAHRYKHLRMRGSIRDLTTVTRLSTSWGKVPSFLSPRPQWNHHL